MIGGNAPDFGDFAGARCWIDTSTIPLRGAAAVERDVANPRTTVFFSPKGDARTLDQRRRVLIDPAEPGKSGARHMSAPGAIVEFAPI